MKWYNKLYSFLKKQFITFFIRISLAMSKIENDLIKNNKTDTLTGGNLEINNIQSELLKSLLRGEYNQEYVDRFYKILKKSDSIIEGYDKKVLLSKLKEHGMDEGNKDLIEYLSGNVDYKKISIKNKTDNSDNYQLIDIVRNNIEIINPESVILGEKPKKLTTLKSKNKDRVFKIEEITEHLHIKKYSEDKYLLEFYINLQHEISNNINHIKDFNNIYYSDKYGDKTEYLIIEHIKINIFNTYNVIKFIAKKI